MNKRQDSPKQTMLMLGKTERDIIKQYADFLGTSNSAALRILLREWQSKRETMTTALEYEGDHDA